MALLHSDYKLKTGDKAPDFSLKGVDGTTYSLPSFKHAKALLIVFACNHCPYVKAKAGEIVRLHQVLSPLGLQVVAINSNDSSRYPDDSFDAMKSFAKERGYHFPYLHDESQAAAHAYGAVCTPDPFLFDAAGRLAYHGRLDNAPNPTDNATEFEMEQAIRLVLAGKPVPWEQRPSLGCSIKWKQ